jgi:hypothetical protein
LRERGQERQRQQQHRSNNNNGLDQDYAWTTAILKVHTLSTCISNFVGQPSCLRPNAWTSRTVRWLDRFATASAELSQGVRVLNTPRSLQSRVASYLVKATVWSRFKTSSSACTNNMPYVSIPMPHNMLETHCHNTARGFPRGPF